jgi:Rad3-related DNA helicase
VSESEVISNYIKNFPFATLRERQGNVLSEIDSAFASGYRRIILEAPTGFGKSPVAISTALTLGSSYICTSTKDLQTQYARDFPFVRVAKGKNNFACEVKDDFIRKIASAIDKIMTAHKERLLETNPDVERDEIINEHFKSSKPTVLISPSLQLGLDLKDHLSRFQVITKVPYPSLGDRWIDEKRKRWEEWYSWQTGLRLVQAYGRSVRSKDDWATTYILDAAFGYFIAKNRNTLPAWFTEAIC